MDDGRSPVRPLRWANYSGEQSNLDAPRRETKQRRPPQHRRDKIPLDKLLGEGANWRDLLDAGFGKGYLMGLNVSRKDFGVRHGVEDWVEFDEAIGLTPKDMEIIGWTLPTPFADGGYFEVRL